MVSLGNICINTLHKDRTMNNNNNNNNNFSILQATMLLHYKDPPVNALMGKSHFTFSHKQQ